MKSILSSTYHYVIAHFCESTIGPIMYIILKFSLNLSQLVSIQFFYVQSVFRFSVVGDRRCWIDDPMASIRTESST